MLSLPTATAPTPTPTPPTPPSPTPTTTDDLYRLYHRDVVKLLQRYFRYQRHLLDDAIQITFLTAHQQIEGLGNSRRAHQQPIPIETIKHPRAWLLTIARTRAIDILREEKRRHEVTPNATSLHMDMAQVAYDPVIDLDALEREEETASLLDRLRPDERDLLVMVFFSGIRIAEFSRAKNVPEGTLHCRLHRALNRLRAMQRAA